MVPLLYYLLRVDLSHLLIGAEGAKTPRKCYRISFVRGRIQDAIQCPVGVWFRGDPAGAFLRGGSPKHPRKAKRLERKSTDNFNRA
jgi:hypothetical protein